MSLQGAVGGIAQTDRQILTTTAPTVLLDAETTGNYLHSIYVAEATGNATSVVLDAFDGTTAYRLATLSLGASAHEWLTIEQRLEPSWSIRATASVANRLHTHITHTIQA